MTEKKIYDLININNAYERIKIMMNNILTVEIRNIKSINHLKIDMPLKPDVYAITGVNGIGKSTMLSCITPRHKRPVSFSALTEFASETSSIKYRINSIEEKWTVKDEEWICNATQELLLRGFQEGSLTNGRDLNKFCVKLNKALPNSQDSSQRKN